MTTDAKPSQPEATAARRRRRDAGRRPAATADKQCGRQAGFLSRLSTGTGAFNMLGHRKVYYAVSGGSGGRARSC